MSKGYYASDQYKELLEKEDRGGDMLRTVRGGVEQPSADGFWRDTARSECNDPPGCSLQPQEDENPLLDNLSYLSHHECTHPSMPKDTNLSREPVREEESSMIFSSDLEYSKEDGRAPPLKSNRKRFNEYPRVPGNVTKRARQCDKEDEKGFNEGYSASQSDRVSTEKEDRPEEPPNTLSMIKKVAKFALLAADILDSPDISSKDTPVDIDTSHVRSKCYDSQNKESKGYGASHSDRVSTEKEDRPEEPPNTLSMIKKVAKFALLAADILDSPDISSKDTPVDIDTSHVRSKCYDSQNKESKGYGASHSDRVSTEKEDRPEEPPNTLSMIKKVAKFALLATDMLDSPDISSKDLPADNDRTPVSVKYFSSQNKTPKDCSLSQTSTPDKYPLILSLGLAAKFK